MVRIKQTKLKTMHPTSELNKNPIRKNKNYIQDWIILLLYDKIYDPLLVYLRPTYICSNEFKTFRNNSQKPGVAKLFNKPTKAERQSVLPRKASCPAPVESEDAPFHSSSVF